MMMLLRNLSNIPGFTTSRRIVVIESDDWGSIRMPSQSAFDRLKANGVVLEGGDSTRYNRFDTLAGRADLDALFNLLVGFRDSNGNHPVFTAVSLCANPDFEKIRESGFETYHLEPFVTTLKRYGREDAFEWWKSGRENRLFVPQFHGREHLNVAVWMRKLQSGDRDTRLAFDEGMWGFRNKNSNGINYQSAFDVEYSTDIELQKQVIAGGLKLFEQLHGYKASFFVPPNGPFNRGLEEVSADYGIRYLSASKIQKEPLGEKKYKTSLHWVGQKNRHGQRYITRNCFFEPGREGADWVDSCLREIEVAFRWRKAAVISSHRVNYIGAIDVKNRENGLRELERLLSGILNRWPDVEFMTSDELGNLMQKEINT